MTWFHRLQLRLRALFQKEKLDARMDDEMRSHIEMQTQENIEAGMKPNEARYAALRQFGRAESVKETCRDQRGVTRIENLAQDVRYGVRMLAKNRGFTTVAVLTLALGIGANTAMFSIVNDILLKPLSYREPERLVRVFNSSQERGLDQFSVTAPAFVEWRNQNTVFEGIAAIHGADFNLTGRGEPERIIGQSCSSSFFQLLGVKPLTGRHFTAEEEQFGKDHVVPNQEPLGKRLNIGDGPERWTEIIGIAPDMRHESLAVAPDAAMYLPMSQRCWGFAQIVVRAAMNPDSISKMIQKSVLELDSNQPIHEIRTMERMVDSALAGRRLQMFLLVIFGGIALTLAAIGTYGVMAYSVGKRTREIGVRMALGAQTGDVLKLILNQGMKLVVAGLCAGVAAAFGLTRLMSTLLYEVRPSDPLTFAGVIVVLSAVALIACFLPARRAARVDPMEALRYE